MSEHLHNTGLSVADLIRTTALDRATLRAGHGGTGRVVRRVQWMEVLDDFANYLAPGDLLLTTAYNLRDDRALQRVLAQQMLESGVVAMVVKCGYYLDAIPYPVRRQADEIALPVFELPREVPFVELAQSIYEQLVDRSYARLRRSAGVHRELVRLVVEGADLPTIVRRAAVLLGSPVAVEDATGRGLAGFSPEGRALPRGDLTWSEPDDLVVPVIARGILHGRVGLVAPPDPQDDDRQALEQVATVIALEIVRSERELRRDTERVEAAVLELVHGAARGSAGLDLPPRPTVLRVSGDVETARALLPDGTPAALDGEELVALVPGDAEPVLPEGAVGGLGEACASPAGLPESHRQAARALALGGMLRGPGAHRYHDLEAYDALLGGLDQMRAAALRRRALEPLGDALQETLTIYLECGASVADTARRTFVHRNTVHYRLRRIEQLTGLDLGRLEDRLLCEVALISSRLG